MYDFCFLFFKSNKNVTMKRFITCILHQLLLGWSNRGRSNGTWNSHARDQKCIHILVGRPEGRRPLMRPRHRWCNNSLPNYLQEMVTKCRPTTCFSKTFWNNSFQEKWNILRRMWFVRVSQFRLFILYIQLMQITQKWFSLYFENIHHIKKVIKQNLQEITFLSFCQVFAVPKNVPTTYKLYIFIIYIHIMSYTFLTMCRSQVLKY